MVHPLISPLATRCVTDLRRPIAQVPLRHHSVTVSHDRPCEQFHRVGGAYCFFPPIPGTAVTCFIHAVIWRTSRSSME